MHRDNINFTGRAPALPQNGAAIPNGNIGGEPNQTWNAGPTIQTHPAMVGQGNGARDNTPALDYQRVYHNQVTAGMVPGQVYAGYHNAPTAVNENLNRGQYRLHDKNKTTPAHLPYT